MKAESISPRNSAPIWQRVIQFEEKLSATAARSLLRVQFSTRDHQRMHELSGKSRAGSLSPEEQVEIDTYERLGCLLDILHAKARHALKKRKSVS